MAQFNIEAHIRTGRALEWLALPDDGERPIDVESRVRKAAAEKFGRSVYSKYWSRKVASNGYITVRMRT